MKQLQPLKGTEKQIRWAKAIRAKALLEKDNQIPSPERAEEILARAPEQNRVRMRKMYNLAARARAKLENETEAEWWIEKRGFMSRFVMFYVNHPEEGKNLEIE